MEEKGVFIYQNTMRSDEIPLSDNELDNEMGVEKIADKIQKRGWKDNGIYKYFQKQLLNSVDTIGGVGMDDLELTRVGLPLIVLYYMVIIV